MTNKKLFLTLTGFALALIAYAPTSLAVNEVCQDGSNNCCVAPQIVEDGGGCGTIRGWVGDEATGSCENPVFDPTGTGSPTVCPAGKAYNCANNSCVCPTGQIVNRCNTTQCITPPSCGGTESYCCSSEHPDAAASGSCVDKDHGDVAGVQSSSDPNACVNQPGAKVLANSCTGACASACTSNEVEIDGVCLPFARMVHDDANDVFLGEEGPGVFVKEIGGGGDIDVIKSAPRATDLLEMARFERDVTNGLDDNEGGFLDFFVTDSDAGADPTNPAHARLSWRALGGANPNWEQASWLDFWTSGWTGNFAERMTISPDGSVGIGTTDPNYRHLLHIVNPSSGFATFGFRMDSPNRSSNFLGLRDDTTTGFGDDLGGIGWSSNTGSWVPSSGWQANNTSAAILAEAGDANHTDTSKPGRLSFWTAPAGAYSGGLIQAEKRMEIDENGYTSFFGKMNGLDIEVDAPGADTWQDAGITITNTAPADGEAGIGFNNGVYLPGIYWVAGMPNDSPNFVIDYGVGSEDFGDPGLNNNVYTFTSQGELGIGTNDPDVSLHIQSDDTGNDGPQMLMIREDSAIATNDILGGIGFDGTDGVASDDVMNASAAIVSLAGSSHGSTSKPGAISFRTKGNSEGEADANIERMRIDQQGNVGIGTAPSSLRKLKVDGDFEVTGNCIGCGGGTWVTSGSDIYFDSGDVGIGTTSPNAKLDVDGSIRAGYDTNTTSYFGRAAVGFNPAYTTDWASFGHIDSNVAGGYAVMQNSSGRTLLNSASGQPIEFREDNDTKVKIVTGVAPDVNLIRTDSTTTAGEVLGSIGFGSSDGGVPQGGAAASAMIYSSATTNHSSTAKGGDLRFYTKPNSEGAEDAPVERMRITHDGKIGFDGEVELAMGGWNTDFPHADPPAQLTLDGLHNSSVNKNTKLLISGMDNEANVKAISVVDENSNELFALNTTPKDKGQAVFKGEVRGGYNSNTTSYFGRAAVGYNPEYSDYASFAHVDSNVAGEYALLQSSNGTTYLNSAPDKNIYFRTGNSSRMTMQPNAGLSLSNDFAIGRDMHDDPDHVENNAEHAIFPFRTTPYFDDGVFDDAWYPGGNDDNKLSIESDAYISFVETDTDTVVGWMEVNHNGLNDNGETIDNAHFSWNGRILASRNQDMEYVACVPPQTFNCNYWVPRTHYDDPSRPSFSFINDSNTGMVHLDENLIGFATGGSTRVTIHSNGLSTYDDLYAAFDVEADDDLIAGDDVIVNGVTVHGSDRRFKKDIEPIVSIGDKLKKLEGVSYKWDPETKPKENLEEVNFGFIAQDVEKVFPDLVELGEDDYYYLKYNGFIPLLLEGYKEQQAELDQLKLEIAELKANLKN